MMIEACITTSAPHRLVCKNKATYQFLWPLFFSSAVPAARTMCKCASRNGVIVSGAVRLQYDDERMCHLIVTRFVEPNRCLISVPLRLVMSADAEQIRDYVKHRCTSRDISVTHLEQELHNDNFAYVRSNNKNENISTSENEYQNHLATRKDMEMMQAVCEPAFPHTAMRNTSFFWKEMGELTELVLRELNNKRSCHRRYVELLHDLYNCDDEDNFDNSNDDDRYGHPEALYKQYSANYYQKSNNKNSNKNNIKNKWYSFDSEKENSNEIKNNLSNGMLLHQRDTLMQQLETMYGGNVLMAHGVMNAPFIEKCTLQTPSQRLEWVRAHELIRRIQQSVPYFSVSLVPWALSMVLSRVINIETALPHDKHKTRECHREQEQSVRSNNRDKLPPVLWGLCPVIDFCSHSFTPSARLQISHDLTCCTDNLTMLSNCDRSEPCIRLVTNRALHRGDELTLHYSARAASTVDDAEYWQMRWGFTPNKSQRKQKQQRK